MRKLARRPPKGKGKPVGGRDEGRGYPPLRHQGPAQPAIGGHHGVNIGDALNVAQTPGAPDVVSADRRLRCGAAPQTCHHGAFALFRLPRG
jgi:hypothetical protein